MPTHLTNEAFPLDEASFNMYKEIHSNLQVKLLLPQHLAKPVRDFVKRVLQFHYGSPFIGKGVNGLTGLIAIG